MKTMKRNMNCIAKEGCLVFAPDEKLENHDPSAISDPAPVPVPVLPVTDPDPSVAPILGVVGVSIDDF